MYEKDKEKEKALAFVQQFSEIEEKLSNLTKEERRKQNFKKSINFALEEVDEFEKDLNHFIKRVEHLVIFQESFQPYMTRDINKMIYNLKELITKNYTKEERERMSKDLLYQVKHVQKARRDLLTKVAMKYIKRNKPKSN